jgi:predicted aspartyl protease
MIAASVVSIQAMGIVSLPVERASNVFFARATVNGEGPFWLTVDTGATLTVLDPTTAAELGLTSGPTDVRPDVGVGARAAAVSRSGGATIFVPGAAPFRPEPLYLVGVRDAEAALGHQIDGVLGHDFLEQFIVEFDYPRGAVRLHPPRAVLAGNATPVRIRTQGNRVVVTARLELADGESLDARLLVDTGSSSGISLNSPFAARHRLEERFPSTELSAAVGVNGMTVRAVMVLSGVSIGSLRLPVRRVALSRDTTGLSASEEFDGILGAAVLRRFRVVLDYQRRQLTLD